MQLGVLLLCAFFFQNQNQNLIQSKAQSLAKRNTHIFTRITCKDVPFNEKKKQNTSHFGS